MISPRGRRRKRRRILLAAAVALGLSAATRPGDARRPPTPPRDGYPDPFWLALLTAVAGGVAGAAGARAIAGRPRGADVAGAAVLETLVAGSVPAAALVSLNPPGPAWWALAGTAAAAGGGAQALLLAVAHARAARSADAARDAADDATRRTALLAGEQIETLRRLAVDPISADRAGWERALDVYAERARAELRAAARRGGPSRE